MRFPREMDGETGKRMKGAGGVLTVVVLLVIALPIAVTATTPGDSGVSTQVATGLDPQISTPPSFVDSGAPLPTPILVPQVVPTDTPTPSPPPSPAPTAVPTATPAPASPSIGVPQRLRIPSIGVDAAVEIVRLESDNSVGTPKNFADVGWYELGARPGEPGNAVIVGHVDSTTGAAVFWDLHKLQPGDHISVLGDDGQERQFVVRGSQRFGHGDAPMDQIYGASDGVHLNLVTCDNDTPFNRRTGEYGGYVVVFADADSTVVAQ